MSQRDLNRLVCAGIVDQQFRKLLVRDPLRAAAAGYYTERFDLTEEEKEMLSQIHAADFDSFVQAIARWILEKRA
ncbi:MAG: hypothetical protein HY868_18495 [Chloroflexi bacterium]|nr:hypothetical protein [Chloroflexota bacterium]